MNSNLHEKFIAHRGESFLAPENTLAAINLAWNNGVNAVEIDVQLTLDQEIVVIHDKNTKRVGDVNRVISRTSLEDLKKIDVGLYKNTRWKEEQIPTLLEVLQTIPKSGKLIIEIKSGVEIIEPLRELLQGADVADSQIEIICFNRSLLIEIKKVLPNYRMLWLRSLDHYRSKWSMFVNAGKTIRQVLSGNLDGVNVWAGKILNERYINLFKKHNLFVYTWTVNDVKTAGKLLELGVDAITTDRPTWLKEKLRHEI